MRFRNVAFCTGAVSRLMSARAFAAIRTVPELRSYCVTGVSAIPQIGHVPGWSDSTEGSIEQV
jgi:hypothetical protein